MKRAIILFWLLLGCSALWAQSSDEQLLGIYEAAESAYDVGRIEESRRLLTDNVKRFSGSLRQSAYRLLSLCALADDDHAAAEEYARMLLRENPYYSTTLDDPQRFIDMVERISGRAESTITTASSHEERLSEVPVPTTLITEQMIRDSGARNLQEVLVTYVPGMNIVDCNDDINIAMRGIFSNGQEKILIMLNGHRLNSYITNTAAPDYSIGLDKLKQIEVLRGPASSLYGGVALTAVVNLITKKGAEVDGLKVRAGYGNHGQLKGNALFGKRYYDLDLLIWGSLYDANGEERDLPPGEATDGDRRKVTVGRTGELPSHELGMSLKWKDLRLMYDMHVSELVSPYTISTLAKPYDIDRYRTYFGMCPSISSTAHHADVRYGRQLGRLAIDGTIFLDTHDMAHYQVISDDTLGTLGQIMGLSDSLSNFFSKHGGISRIINGLETTYGAQVKGDYNYVSNDNHNGYITFGAEFSHFSLDDVQYLIGYDFVETLPETPDIQTAGKGDEKCYNAFAQMKHQWRSLILNAGLRYDHKVRYNKSRVNEFSPRLALIYVRPKWNAKLSYSKSFVDAPYLYRKTNLFAPILSGVDLAPELMTYFNDLQPETMHSVQLTFAGTQWLKGLDFEVNLFHNRAEDLIMTEITNHMNTGKHKSIGAEFLATYRRGPLTAHLDATWMNTLKASILYRDIDDNNSTPAFASNLVVAWQPTRQLRLHTKAAFQGRQTTYNVSYKALAVLEGILDQMSEAYAEERFDDANRLEQQYSDIVSNELVSEQRISSRITFDVGAEYRLGKLTLGLDIHNLLNKSYYQSGMNTGLVPQRGRWFMGTLGYEF